MATLATDIEVFINRAQQKIGTLGDTILSNDKEGICVDYDISLLQELSAAVDMFQNSCCAPDENLSYKTIHYLTEKASLSVIPIAIFDNNCLVDQTILPTGGYLEGPKGDKGDAATIDIGSVSTLPAGSNATVTNSGNSSAAEFNFGIPRGADGDDGSDGDTGWSPIFAIVADGIRKVLQLTGWTGGTGTAPTTTGLYIGASGYVVSINDAVDIRGAQGDSGLNGDNGLNGWTPVIAIISDGERRVMQVVSWMGGSGTAPTSGVYVSLGGFTTDISLAIDIRGAIGPQGEPFVINAEGLLSDRNTYDDEATGFTFLATDTGDVYIKNSPLTGDWGPPISFVGDKGWSPVLNTVISGERIVLQVSDWIGGEGTKPPAGQYISELGFTNDVSDATNIRGDRGEFFIDAQSFLSDRGSYDFEERPFAFYAWDNGKIYLKNSDTPGDWTDGFDWRGERGPDGPVGTAGENAYTYTTGNFTVPSVGGTVNVQVLNTGFMSVGQTLYIESAGYYTVTTILSANLVTLTNTGYTGNAAPTTVITLNKKVSPAGISGASPVWGAITGTITDQTDLISYLSGNYWNQAGNTLTGRKKFGSVSGAFGWDEYVNNAIVAGVGNDGKRYYGTSAAFTDTFFSVKGHGSTSATYNTQWKASNDTVLGWMRNDGLLSAFGGLSTDGIKSIAIDTTNGRILLGLNAGSGVSGIDSSYLGFESGLSASGNNNFGGGYQALYSILGDNNNGYGYRALYDVTGSSNNAFGVSAGMGMVAEGNNLFGNSSGMNSTGSNCNFMGYLSGNNNAGARCNGFGYEALNGNSGDDVVGFGLYAGKSNTRPNLFTVAAITDVFWNNVGDQGNTTLGVVRMQAAMAPDGTNQSAAASIFKIVPARGVGNAPSGDIVIQFANIQASGTTRHTLSDGLVFEANTGYIWSKTSTSENRLLSGKYVVQSGNYTHIVGDQTLEYTGTGGHTFTLHTAVGYKNTEITVINTGSGNLTVNGGTLIPGTTIKLTSNGTNWI